jgi:beta-glucosidase
MLKSNLKSLIRGNRLDWEVKIEGKIDHILSNLTLEEKIDLISGKPPFGFKGNQRLGIPQVKMADGPMGVRKQVKATAFPAPIAAAATWNRSLTREIGEAIARECCYYNIRILLAPAVNMYRIPQNGRNFEYMGEDPYLAGQLAAKYIQGVQGKDVIAVVKHFACNNMEYDRHRTNSEVDERTLREIYLPAFQTAIKEGKCWALMTAYNSVNGVHCSENFYLIKDILKKDWGFNGFVMSDWLSVYSINAAVAGLDLEMPGAEVMTQENISTALKKHIITEDAVNDKIRRILRAFLYMQFMGKKQAHKQKTINWESHHRLALQAAQEGIVLLKNENKLLPLNHRKVSKIAVLGPNAHPTPTSGGGAARVEPYRQKSFLEGIREYLVKKEQIIHISYTRPTELTEKMSLDLSAQIKQCDAVLVCVGFNEIIEGEAHDRPFELPADQVELIKTVQHINPATIVIITAGGGIGMGMWIDKTPAVIHSWYLGQVAGEALAAIIFGAACPSGKLPISIERQWQDAATYETYDVEKSRSDLPPPDSTYGKTHTLIPIPYKEGIFIGYRHFDKNNIKPLFPFGHGLSYTTFQYANLVVTSYGILKYHVELTITNTGKCPGREIVQVYVRDIESSVARPFMELKGFSDVFLKPRKRKRINIVLERQAFAFFSIQDNSWRIEPGDFEILVGSSSRDIRLKQVIRINDEIIYK